MCPVTRSIARIPLGLWVVALLLTAAGLNALYPVSNDILDPEPGSLMLGVLQFATATSSIISAIAVVRQHRWAHFAIAAWGAIAAAMVVLLEPLGFVDALDRTGLWQGAAAILASAAAMIWYVRRRSAALSDAQKAT